MKKKIGILTFSQVKNFGAVLQAYALKKVLSDLGAQADCIDYSFKDEENILVNHYGITEDDYVDNDDSYYMPFMKKLREAQRDNSIDQIENRKIFE